MAERITVLKTDETLEANLRLLNTTLEDFKARYIAAAKAGSNKPTSYAPEQEYTELFKLGPVVSDIADAVKALETELAELHRYVGEQLGRDPNNAELPPVINVGGIMNITAEGNGDVTFTSAV